MKPLNHIITRDTLIKNFSEEGIVHKHMGTRIINRDGLFLFQKRGGIGTYITHHKEVMTPEKAVDYYMSIGR